MGWRGRNTGHRSLGTVAANHFPWVLVALFTGCRDDAEAEPPAAAEAAVYTMWMEQLLSEQSFGRRGRSEFGSTWLMRIFTGASDLNTVTFSFFPFFFLFLHFSLSLLVVMRVIVMLFPLPQYTGRRRLLLVLRSMDRCIYLNNFFPRKPAFTT